VTSTVEIRPATADDFAGVLDLWSTARSAAAVTPDTRESLEQLPAGALLVALDRSQVVGALIAGWDGWRGNLYRLAVLPGHRRRGIGRALIEAGHAHLHAQGARRVTALVGADEDVALALWRAVGYRHDIEIARLSRNL
jgi:ribosomal protein S18 acetylase RimI-like enzyme